ncbi:hypothetical protein FOS14_23685 [Skermania sp. ID1734]|uniref:hypothetical protein n=1 Tax=Skermania sp. ID1734 TaxID=2597516 RepID=UPI00117F27CA|nr:hypothetical protein [Skermania sp. ID1734]TSD93199.1 hypothetical protein FOS14_23685 [Skermania sp. ID1734]
MVIDARPKLPPLEPIEGVSFRLVNEEDWPAIEAGFSEAFNGAQRPRSEWLWKYGANHERVFALVAVDRQSELIAYYGSLIGHLQVDGQEHKSLQPCDVFRLKREGTSTAMVFSALVQETILHALQHEDFAIGFGFPGARHLQIGLKRLGYSDPVDVIQLVRAASAGIPRVLRWPYRVDDHADLASIESLWQRSSHRYPVAQVRDSAYLDYRYVKNPINYIYRSVSRGKRLHAWTVLRKVDNQIKVVDLVWDGRDSRALRLLNLEIIRCAVEAGATTLEMWLNGDEKALRIFAAGGWGPNPNPLPLGLTVAVLKPGLEPHAIAKRMYVTLGDSDLA